MSVIAVFAPSGLAGNEDLLTALASLLWGVAVAWVVAQVVFFLAKPRLGKVRALDFEHARRTRLREDSALYRWFEPLVDKLAGWNHGRNPARLDRLRRDLAIAREKLPWTPEEFVAARQVESVIIGLIGAVLGFVVAEDLLVAVLVGGAAAYGYQRLALQFAGERARKRMRPLKQRLPFAIDLMALMMEAGASFQESMATVIRENEGHPLAQEFSEVQREIALGRTRQEALQGLQDRLQDEDITEFVFAVTKGEELGTPLAQILRTQAEQIRLKRSQWAEKASGEAQVNIVFPGMVIMIACLLIITAPFILAALYAK